jgi:glycosyltransferase involved in cell wall biosynthesis
MKIALIDPSLFTLPYDAALVAGLAQNGHEVLLFGKRLAPDEAGKGVPYLEEFFYPGFEAPPLKNLPRPLFLALKGIAHPFCLARFLRRLRVFRPDIVHFQWAPLPVIDRLFIPRFRRIAPTVLTVHDSTPFNGNPGMRLQAVGAVAILHAFDRLIVHTDEARRRLIGYRVSPERIDLIPHGPLEPGREYPPPAPRADQSVTFLLFGKLKPYKGADLLIRALALLPPEAKTRARLRIAGQPYMDVRPLLALAAKLGVADRIVWDLRFLGETEIASAFGEADAMVMPYRDIDASGVLMQALGAARPIIASRIGLFAEMLEDGRHGYLVSPENPSELARAMAKLIEDGARRREMGEAVRALKNAIPDWHAIAAMTERLYREMKSDAFL